MKRIVGIDEEIKSLDGESIKVDPKGEIVFTVKRVLINLLGSAVAVGDPKGLSAAEESMVIADLGKTLAKATTDWEYNDSDNVDAILKRIINDNNIGPNQRYPAYIIGLVYEKVKHAVAFKAN